MTFYPRNVLVAGLFGLTMILALNPTWGAIAVLGCVCIELLLLLGIAGFGRGNDVR